MEKRFEMTTTITRELKELMEEMETNATVPDGNPDPNRIRTGISELDKRRSVIRTGDLVVVGGLPGAGATAFALQLALLAAKEGLPSWVCTTQVHPAQIAARLVALHRKIPVAEVLPTATDQMADIGNLPLYVNSSGVNGVGDLESDIQQSRKESGLVGGGVVVVDGCLLSADDHRPWNGFVAEGNAQAMALKAMARRLGVCVVVTVEADSSALLRGHNVPSTFDLRWAGGKWLAEPDVVVMVRRNAMHPQEHHFEGELDHTQLMVVNNKMGTTTHVLARFEEAYLAFQDIQYR